jgi:phosphocarrier protein HPr
VVASQPGPDTGGRLERRVTITGSLGLHARPAARFVKLAGTFDAAVEVSANGVTVPGGSIMGLMMLGAGDGTELLISARGPEAAVAIDALAALVASGFEGDTGEGTD